MAPRIPRAALAAALALSVTACKKDDSADASKASMAVLPKDANVFFGARMGEVTKSQLWKDHVAPKVGEDDSYQEMVEACGKDLLPEMDSIVGAVNTEAEMMTVVFHGITRAELEACSENAPEESKFTLSDEGELMVFTDSDDEATYAHWLDDDSVLIAGPMDDSDESGEAAQKQAVLDRVEADESLADNEAMMELIDGLDTTDSIYFAADLEGIPDNPLDGKWVSAAGSVEISDGVAIDARAGFSSADVASELADKADAVIGMAVMKPELKWIPDRVDISVDDSAIVGKAELSKEDVGKLEDLAETGQLPID